MPKQPDQITSARLKAKRRPQTAWALEQRGYIFTGVIRETRRDVINEVEIGSRMWADWKRDGYRAVKIRLEVIR
jgi:hypothetical protein